MIEVYGGITPEGTGFVEIHGSAAPTDTVPAGAPPMGTPEFRLFTQTPEWMELRHEQALRDNELWGIDPRLVIRAKYFENNDEPRSPHFATRRLGATATYDPMLFSRDFRESLPVDDPMRMDYEEEIYGKTEAELAAEDLAKITSLHRATLLLTKPVY
jgi:hypothetical protein